MPLQARRRATQGLGAMMGAGVGAGAFGGLSGLAGPCAAQDKTIVTLGTATPGGGFPAYGAAYADILNAADPSLDIRPQNTKGSTENVPLVDSGQIDLGLATGEVTYEALQGIGGPAARNIRIVNAMYSQSGLFAVRADSPYRSIGDLKGQTIAGIVADSQTEAEWQETRNKARAVIRAAELVQQGLDAE